MSAELSGVDLARQALAAAREAAKKNSDARRAKPKRRAGQMMRRDGREPLALGTAITMMMTERGLVVPAAGGSVLAQWEDIVAAAAPELAGHARAVAFDSDTGRLDVVPDSPAYGTTLRWNASKLITAANQRVRGANVRTLHVLPPAPAAAAGPAVLADDPAPARRSAAPAGPVRTERAASDGYLRAVAAHREAAPPRRADLAEVDAAIAKAVGRQTRAMRRLSERAFPEPPGLGRIS